MEPAVQTKSRKPFYVWIALFAVPIWAVTFLVLMWRHLHRVLNASPVVIVIFGVPAAVFVTLSLRYFLFPHRRGPYAIHLVGASIGGLMSMTLTVPVFAPLIEFQMRLMAKVMEAFNLPLGQWNQIMDPFGYLLEIALSGMAAGWICVMVGSRLKARRIEQEIFYTEAAEKAERTDN
jgi:hypothetical protein